MKSVLSAAHKCVGESVHLPVATPNQTYWISNAINGGYFPNHSASITVWKLLEIVNMMLNLRRLSRVRPHLPQILN